jgi:hypothetical protein
LHKVEVQLVKVEKLDDTIIHNAAPLWPTVLLSFVALIQVLVWTVVGAYSLVTDKHYLWTSIAPLLIAAT